ncbi:tripartite tricarboxylate transporter substrate binding protein [Advenella mimigardefordensis]|uniref:Putative Bug-like extracytoplasmic solute binding receptor, TTT family n=1 Tax=Advenella mimigardefordensis (strain DSM 17166 / LMG 22922 / DPN7) TaxID=1247726 RepID=W0P9W7_ADVMD|nr:tripartite tricarboxylate transporter substrate binding protein [Advenella mimigardefordensis]AHG62277.1 putative Bug-like extracytoplasmic solute binding receptor, TTT family [Advenella mimigardefordensis DPN7]
MIFDTMMQSNQKIRIKYAMLVVAASVLSTTATAQNAYPENPVTILVPFGPGGTSDIMARILAKHLREAMGGNLIIDNKGGAGGAIGMMQLKRAKADGYTLGLSVIGPEVLQPGMRSTGYTYQDFDHICGTYSVPLMMMVPQDSKFKNMQDVVAFASKNPRQLTYGTSGTGTLLHIAMEMLMKQANATALHVPYKSSAEMVTGLLGKQVMVISDTTTVAKQYKLRPLGIFSDQRLKSTPQVATTKEGGWPIQATIWGGLIAPKGLPKEIVAKLETACEKAVNSEGYKADVEPLDTPPHFLNAEAFAAFVKDESEKYTKLIQEMGITSEK